jgi:threonine dehydratase
MHGITVEDIAAAERRIRSLVRETPLEVSDALSERVGGKVLLKLENLQHTGSFKVRGASNKILSLGHDLKTPVVAASSGNHGAAVAYVLRELGGKGLIFVPTGASPAKVENIRHFGAEVAFFGDDSIET